MLTTAATRTDRHLPVDEVFAEMLPERALRRGHVVGCSGSAAVTTAFALASRSVIAGSWVAVVGVPMLGVEAVDELGVPLARLVRVDVDGGPGVWAERVAAAVDGFYVVLTRPPAGAERVVRKVRTRLHARGAVLIAVSPGAPTVSCDVELTTTETAWVGLGHGTGRLIGRTATIRCGGRRVPRPIERTVWLPSPDGRVELVDEAAESVGLSRAG